MSVDLTRKSYDTEGCSLGRGPARFVGLKRLLWLLTESRQGNGHSAKRLPQGYLKGSGKPWWGKRKSSKKVDGSRSVLEFESSGLGGW